MKLITFNHFQYKLCQFAWAPWDACWEGVIIKQEKNTIYIKYTHALSNQEIYIGCAYIY